ncbi:MAG: hypothetical protein MI867_12210, partial [Pseudomonadales bacterium]|nr:hypothetical protein [Pseudomonadales bacterium]
MVDPIVDGNTVGLDIDGKVFQFDKIDFQTGSLLSADQRTIVAEQHRETILASDCNLWCRWQTGVDFKPGYCRLYDAVLNDDGSIT